MKYPQYQKLRNRVGAWRRELGAGLMLLASASCVPLNAAEAPKSRTYSAATPLALPSPTPPEADMSLPEPLLLEPVLK